MRLYGIVTGLYNSRVVPLGRPRTARLRATGGIGRRVAPAGTEDWPLSTGARVAAAGGLCGWVVFEVTFSRRTSPYLRLYLRWARVEGCGEVCVFLSESTCPPIIMYQPTKYWSAYRRPCTGTTW